MTYTHKAFPAWQALISRTRQRRSFHRQNLLSNPSSIKSNRSFWEMQLWLLLLPWVLEPRKLTNLQSSWDEWQILKRRQPKMLMTQLRTQRIRCIIQSLLTCSHQNLQSIQAASPKIKSRQIANMHLLGRPIIQKWARAWRNQTLRPIDISPLRPKRSPGLSRMSLSISLRRSKTSSMLLTRVLNWTSKAR